MNKIIAKFVDTKEIMTEPLWQYDYGQILIIEGLKLPHSFEVHFSNLNDDKTTTSIGTITDGIASVQIPDIYLTVGRFITAFIYLHTGEEDGETTYAIVIPVTERPRPTHEVPIPVQQSEIEQTLAALNSAVVKSETNVTHYPKIVEGYWYVWDAFKEEWVNTGVYAVGDDGVGISDIYINSDYTLTIIFSDGTSYTTTSIRGPQGEPGKVYDLNSGKEIKLWYGTQEEYNNLTNIDPDTIYNIRED